MEDRQVCIGKTTAGLGGPLSCRRSGGILAKFTTIYTAMVSAIEGDYGYGTIDDWLTFKGVRGLHADSDLGNNQGVS
jgi:hypothetical protein